MASCWSTYHLIGDVMRGNALLKPDFNERLMQKLESEPVVLAPRDLYAVIGSAGGLVLGLLWLKAHAAGRGMDARYRPVILRADDQNATSTIQWKCNQRGLND